MKTYYSDSTRRRVRCKSGLWGIRSRLRESYANADEWRGYSDTYGLAKRLGYGSARAAWEDNPIVESSTNPADFRKFTPPPPKPWKRDGSTGFINDRGERVCTGSMMGRPTICDVNEGAAPRLRLARVDMSADGCYDTGGAYWGNGGASLWCAWLSPTDTSYYGPVEIFLRARDREEAKREVRRLIPNAIFYR